MLKRILIGGALLMTLVAVYAAAGFYLVPKLAKDKLPGILTDLTGQTVKMTGLQFDPFQLSAGLQGFELSLKGKPLFNFAELAVDVAVMESVKQRSLIVQSVTLRKPLANIERYPDGRFNFSELLEHFSKTGDKSASPENTEASKTPPVLIHQIALEDGHVAWADMSGTQQHQEALLPLSFSISELSTQPDSRSKFNMSFKLASGGGLDWQGDVSLFPIHSRGQIKLYDITLNKIWEMFLQDNMPLQISDGVLALNADYTFNSAQNTGLQLTVSQANTEVKKLTLKAKNQADTLISVPELAVRKVDFDLNKQRLRVGEVSSQGANIKAWMQPDGMVNYQALFAEPATNANSQTQTQAVADTSAKPWQIEVDTLALNQYQIEFTDRSLPKPLEITLSDMHCQLQHYSNVDGIRLPLDFNSRFNKIGQIKINGDMALQPFSANLAVDLRDIKLKTFQAYVDPFINLDLVDGDLNTQGHLQLQTAEPLQINFQGDSNIDSLITRDKAKNIDFVKWSNLEFKQMVIDVAKQDFKLGKVIFDQPYVRFMIKKDGTNNVSDLLVSKADDKPAAKPVAEKTLKPVASTKSPEPKITIGKIEFKQGGADFADYSLFLPFVAKMNSLAGAVDGFSSNSDEAVKLKLQGKVYDLATVSIDGNYLIKNGDSDIKLKFSNMPLPLITPYMADFAGYKIEKGQMALDLTYSIKKAQLSAQNKIMIDQLVLGEKVDNPKAVSLPLELGIALLKDADGKIKLDFPISGSLENPEFSVSSLVADVIVNVITKAVTSPFKAIASLFDSDADMSTVTFAAGSGELAPDETAKLDQIAKALDTKQIGRAHF